MAIDFTLSPEQLQLQANARAFAEGVLVSIPAQLDAIADPGEAFYSTRAAFKVALQALGLSGRLNTAFIERVNLTVRHGVAALARRTWAKAQPAPQLLAHLQWWRAYSHFVRPYAALRVALVQPRE
jgi:hypothetical protein